MNDTEKFLFDLQGFLKVPGFLSTAEVDALNRAFDANEDRRGQDGNHNTRGNLVGEKRRGMFTGMLQWDKPHCLPFRDLLAHARLVPYLDTLFGRGWKMDHSPFMLCGGKGSEGLILHGSTSRTFGGAQYYAYANDTMRCGMIVCQFQLADVNQGDGGLCVVPGSHKANFPLPAQIQGWEEHQEIVYNIPCKAGDMVIFNEATLHGTLPWTAKHERRSLLYRYSPKYLHFAGGTYQTSQPEWVAELTEAQQAVLEPPYIYNRPLIEEDGVTVVRPRVG
ncbi:MAG: hypothetical protein GKR89_21665 [Candidatus Latescibacteria bacterium]|nr:hypothetical protein [Candidatus Latescibacterota bacterium]